MAEPRKREPRPLQPGPRQNRSAVLQIPPSIAHGANAERQARARARLAAQERHRRVCREAERHASLVSYYGPRPVLAVPLAEYLGRRWVA